MATETRSTRQIEIIEAAAKILTKAGVNGLTIKNLANEIQFSEAALYRHFNSKEEIIVAMLEYLIDILDDRYQKALAAALTPEEQFVALFTEKFSFFKNHKYFVAVVFSDGLLEQSEKINNSIHKVMQVKTKYLKPILEEGQRIKVFTDSIPTDDMVNIVMGAFRLRMFKWRLSGFKADIMDKSYNLIDSIFALIKNK